MTSERRRLTHRDLYFKGPLPRSIACSQILFLYNPATRKATKPSLVLQIHHITSVSSCPNQQEEQSMDYNSILVTELRKMVEQRGLANTLTKKAYQMRKHELVQALRDDDTAMEAKSKRKEKQQAKEKLSGKSMPSRQDCVWSTTDCVDSHNSTPFDDR